MAYVHETVFLIFLIMGTSIDQFGVQSFTKILLHFGNITWSPTLDLESLSFLSTL